MAQLTVTGFKGHPEDDGSHQFEITDGSGNKFTATIPADQVQALLVAVQNGIIERVHRLAEKGAKHEGLAMRELTLTNARPAILGAATNLAIMTAQLGTLVLVGEDRTFRRLQRSVLELLEERAGPKQIN